MRTSTSPAIHARLDHHMLGGKWAKLPSGQRSLVFAFPELGHRFYDCGAAAVLHNGQYDYPGKGLHYHLLYRAPENPRIALTDEELDEFIRNLWTRFVPSGSTKASRLSSEEARHDASEYACKELWRPSIGEENWFILPPPRKN
jgi:hypothetical protein